MKTTGSVKMRLSSGGLGVASGLFSLWQGVFPLSMPAAGGMGGVVAGTPVAFPVPPLFNLVLGIIVLVTGIIVIAGWMYRSWPGVLMIVYGALMVGSGTIMVNSLLRNVIVTQTVGPLGVLRTFVMPAFGIAMLAMGALMVIRQSWMRLK